ncbi:MAG: hypothetical protein JXR97_03375 [Planctomycetes bacterium]|nr:hypothetical protein [Planctomycetota bacterium]
MNTRHLIPVWFAIVTALASMASLFAAEQKADFGWCEVTCPESAAGGENFTLTVKVKEAAAGMKLGGDVHLNKPKGVYGGYGYWGGNPKPVKAGDTVKLKYKMPAKEGIIGAHVLLYLSKEGFNEAEKKQASPVIKLAGTKADSASRPASVTFKKSWISIGESHKGENSSAGEELLEGDELVLPVEYYVDPSDDWGGTQLEVWALGPWVDCPDGKYSTKRMHHNYPGTNRSEKCEVGKTVTHEFKIKIPKPFTETAKGVKVGDGMMFMIFFKGADGKNWPWSVRGGNVKQFLAKDYTFRLDSPVPGNLFSYAEPVVMEMVLGPGAVAGEAKSANYNVYNISGAKVASGSAQFTVKGAAQRVPLKIETAARGTMRIEVDVEGWGMKESTFARIPDLMTLIGNDRTCFGAQLIDGNEEAVKSARRLGLTICRVWLGWNTLEPKKDMWRGIDRKVKNLRMLKENGIDPWLLFDGPPAWAVDNPKSWGTHFAPFPFRDADVASVITKLSNECKDNIIGYEWLNEIVPGKDCADPVADYLRFCKVATNAAKAVNPSYITTLAGGLWPRTFRKSLLAAGVGKHVDVLPVHYSSFGGVEEAKGDLAAVGAEKVVVWDNETARGWSTWEMPLAEALKNTTQSNWVLSQWPGEFLAGSKRMVYFGGQPDAAGNWSYMWGDMSPRPIAATLGVLVSKLYKAKPLGQFAAGKSGTILLFENRAGRPLMVVSSLEKDGEKIGLEVGEGALTATDYQGNESSIAVTDGKAELAAGDLRFFAEGGDLDILKANVVPEIMGGSGLVPQFSMLKETENQLFVRLHNLYDRQIKCSLGLKAPAEWNLASATEASLAPGESKIVSLSMDLSKAESKLHELAVLVRYDWDKLPVIEKKFSVNVISRSMVGNLLKNGGFELAGDKAGSFAGWSSNKFAKRMEWKKPDELGHDGAVLCFEKTGKSWASIGQKIDPLPGGQEYVYSAWFKSKDLAIGSNVAESFSDGKSKTLYQPHVFVTSPTQEHWELFTARLKMPDNLVSASFIPVCKGDGVAYVDNVRVALYEGSDYIAEAHKAKGKIMVDGDLNDFDRSCPIPLLGKSQLRAKAGYEWSPENISGVAYLNWDASNLYLGVEVIDDKHKADQTEAGCLDDDCVILALHPVNRQPGQDSKAFELAFSSVKPGGSGRHTIYRPAEHSGGLKSGSLAKDSSTYDIVIKRTGNRTVYEVAMPLADLGGIKSAFGTKVGMSLMLKDNDGAGNVASMIWGGGLLPAWAPGSFGVLTFVDNE